MLRSVNSARLAKLSDYPISVKRSNITDSKLKGLGADHSSGVALDLCDGVCETNSESGNSIIIRSTASDGNVLFNHG